VADELACYLCKKVGLLTFGRRRKSGEKQSSGRTGCKSRCAPTIVRECCYGRFRFELTAEAPHETALYSQVVLTSAIKVGVEIIDLDGAQGNVPGQGDIGSAARGHCEGVARR
jgi:hypothetical protein